MLIVQAFCFATKWSIRFSAQVSCEAGWELQENGFADQRLPAGYRGSVFIGRLQTPLCTPVPPKGPPASAGTSVSVRAGQKWSPREQDVTYRYHSRGQQSQIRKWKREKRLILQACWLLTLSRAALQKCSGIGLAGFQTRHWKRECLVPEVGCFWRKMKPLCLLRTLNKRFAMMAVTGLSLNGSKLLG